MANVFVTVGQWLRSIQGWAFGVSLLPAITAFIAGLFDRLPWAAIVAYSTVALAAGATLVLLALVIAQKAAVYFTKRKERARIASQINEYMTAGHSRIDTPTAAAIWAGTRDDDDVNRHLRFRLIKAAINRGEIRNTIQVGDPRQSPARLRNLTVWANRHTHLPLTELRDFLIRQGVVEAADFEESNRLR